MQFPASFTLLEGAGAGKPPERIRDLGYMLYDMDFSNPRQIRPIFFRAVMRDGVIDLTDCGVVG